jgi:ABC-type molybdate transport system substrate-binding protein
MNSLKQLKIALCSLSLLAIGHFPTAHANDILIQVGIGAKGALTEILPLFEQSMGIKVQATYAGSVAQAKKSEETSGGIFSLPSTTSLTH